MFSFCALIYVSLSFIQSVLKIWTVNTNWHSIYATLRIIGWFRAYLRRTWRGGGAAVVCFVFFFHLHFLFRFFFLFLTCSSVSSSASMSAGFAASLAWSSAGLPVDVGTTLESLVVRFRFVCEGPSCSWLLRVRFRFFRQSLLSSETTCSKATAQLIRLSNNVWYMIGRKRYSLFEPSSPSKRDNTPRMRWTSLFPFNGNIPAEVCSGVESLSSWRLQEELYLQSIVIRFRFRDAFILHPGKPPALLSRRLLSSRTLWKQTPWHRPCFWSEVCSHTRLHQTARTWTSASHGQQIFANFPLKKITLRYVNRTKTSNN